MRFESNNFNSSKINNNDPKKEFFGSKISKFLKRTILLSAVSIASYVGYNKFLNIEDYTQVGEFSSAFKKARQDGHKLFYWNGKKFTTDLVDKEFSDLYWESKKFLQDYYSSDYFKSKNIPTTIDSGVTRLQIWNKLLDDPNYINLSNKLTEEDLNHDEFNELKKYRDIIYSKNVDTTQEFKNKMDSLQNYQTIERIKNLNTPAPFLMTHYKGSRREEGSFDKRTKAIFVYKNKNDKDITTSVHELSHKSTNSNDLLLEKGTDSFNELKDRALKLAKLNPHLLDKYGIAFFDYLSRQTEIDARQNSARFYLFKNFNGYKPDTIFTEEHYEFLKNNYKKLPIDIQQLMDLFPDKDIFISNMNTY